MLKNLLILALLFLPGLPVLAQSVSTEWVQRYNGPGTYNDNAAATAVDDAGNVYVTGTRYGSTTGDDYQTIKYYSNGDTVWVRRYNTEGSADDRAHAIAVDGEGNVYVTGHTYSFGSGTWSDYLTIKYDASGNLEWTDACDGTGNGYDYARAIAVDASGNVYVTGWSDGSEGDTTNYLTVKYDDSGNEVWRKEYNRGEYSLDHAEEIAVDASGNIYVTGRSYGGVTTDYDYATIKYDPDGNEVWDPPARIYNGDGNGVDGVRAIAVDASGNIYVTGRSYGGVSTDYDYATIKYDPDGNEVWDPPARRYNGDGNAHDLANAIAVDASGNVYITGESQGDGTQEDYATIKYDPDGNEVWDPPARRYNGDGNGYDLAHAIAVYGSGHLYVTGGIMRIGGERDYATVKYDAFNGNQLWVQTYNGDGNGSDVAGGVVLDGSGNIYVRGSSEGDGTGYDYATIKYDAAGNELWVERYNGPGDGDDGAWCIAVDDLGNAYVTGHSWGPGTAYDYVTLKYDVSGDEVWVQRFGGDYRDYPWSMAVKGTDYIYVTGLTGEGDDSSPYEDYTTIKYDASTGNELWATNYNGLADSMDEASAMAVDAFGYVYVTGESWGEGTFYDWATVKYDALGSEVWVRRYDGEGWYDEDPVIAVDNFGYVYVAGISHGKVSGTDADYVTIKYNPDGSIAWERRYNGDGNDRDYARDIAVDYDGNVYVTGYTYSSITLYDFLTIKYDGAGNLMWVQQYDGDGNGYDKVHAMALDGDGNVYVTGESWGDGTDYDYVTIKYDPSGNETWIGKYNGDANGSDVTWDIAVGDDGNIYVTGGSMGIDTGYDYATVKYSKSGSERWVERYDGPGDLSDCASSIAVHSSGCIYVTGWSGGIGTDLDYATIKYCQQGGGGGSSVTAYSPVDLIITDPFGDSIGVDFNTMADATYDTSQDLNGDGDNDDQVIISDPYLGDYLVRVVAEPGEDTGHYTLTMQMGDNGETVLIDSASVPSVGESDTASYTVMEYLKGDANSDGVKSIADAVFLINYLFKDGTSPDPVILGDANCINEVTIADVVYLVNYLFRDGPPPCS